MTSFRVTAFHKAIKGSLSLPGDKSIAHRSVILGALASNRTVISNFPANDDCRDTVSILTKLGVPIRCSGSTVTVEGKGLYGLRAPRGGLRIRESGTTFRLMLGVLAGQPFSATLTAGSSLARRPMRRVVSPLSRMGARLVSRSASGEDYAPITVTGGGLRAITYSMPVASAQVKSAIMLAGLYAAGTTRIIEKLRTRDHTERMLALFKADVSGSSVRGGRQLVSPGSFHVPGDISSAAFFIVLACIVPGSDILLKNVSLNRTRTGFIPVLKRMGADIRIVKKEPGSEPSGDIRVRSSCLRATVIRKDEIPFLIDELPVLMVAGVFSRGTTVFKAAGELRVKETDRIASMLDNLGAMGAVCKTVKTGGDEDIIISGPVSLTGTAVKSHGDHRTAMSMAVAGARAAGVTTIDDVGCIDKSFPGFIAAFKKLIACR